MIAFLKRRWILLSCAVLLLACSFFNLEIRYYEADGVSETRQVRTIGLYQGAFAFWQLRGWESADWDVLLTVHSPQVGNVPKWILKDNVVVSIPLWIPFFAVVAWMVFRERRWGKERERSRRLDTPRSRKRRH